MREKLELPRPVCSDCAGLLDDYRRRYGSDRFIENISALCFLLGHVPNRVSD